MTATAADGLSIDVEENVECVTRDGVILRSDVYHPSDGHRYPVLVCRTPYDKRNPRSSSDALSLAQRDYTVVVQDQRGRYASEGEYQWMFRDKSETHDAGDGYDTIEWAAELQWSDGRVGTWGHSNEAWAVWMLISTQPPSLKATLASGMCQNILDLNFGIFETGRRLQWTYGQAADARRRLGGTDGPLTSDEAYRRWEEVERGKYIWWLPLGDIPSKVFSDLDDQLQLYHRSQNVEFMNFGEFCQKVTVPMMQITGWWDRLIGTIDNFEGISKHGDVVVRESHGLIIGPWGHDRTNFSRQIGPVDYGPEADRRYADIIARWYDFHLKGIDDGMSDEAPIQLFVLGENRWRGEQEWPLARTVYTDFFLQSDGSANTVRGDGRLTPDAGWSEAVRDVYNYDPRDPVMSLMSADAQTLPVDQSPHDHRTDILVYQTPPLEDDLTVVGPVALKLWAQTDGPDTDWTAKLAIVLEDGLAINLTYGIMRARYRNGYRSPQPLEPDRPYQYSIKLNPVGCVFRRGERIRLYISSSDFPNFDRNHNNGGDYWTDNELRIAHQTVFHSVEMPSRLVLPVIPP